jgi:PiT family inorganic phosphate transporter
MSVVGFLREWLDQPHRQGSGVLARYRGEPDVAEVEAALREFRNAPAEEKQRILQLIRAIGPGPSLRRHNAKN